MILDRNIAHTFKIYHPRATASHPNIQGTYGYGFLAKKMKICHKADPQENDPGNLFFQSIQVATGPRFPLIKLEDYLKISDTLHCMTDHRDMPSRRSRSLGTTGED
jgi:hypothetical protein